MLSLEKQVRKNKWLFVEDDDEVQKENQFLQIKHYTQESKQRQNENLLFILPHMQMLGW